MKNKITKNMTFQDVMDKYPNAIDVVMNYGLHCIGCHVAASESLEDGAKAHGLKAKQIADMVREINKIANK